MLRTGPKEDLGLRMSIAISMWQARQYPLAEKAFREILADFPDAAEAHYNLGLTLARQSRPDEAAREILAATGRVDHLINNAGVGGNAVAEECPPELYLSVMNVNLCGAVRCVQAVLPQMRERGSGTIVNITSVAGRIAALAQSQRGAVEDAARRTTSSLCSWQA